MSYVERFETELRRAIDAHEEREAAWTLRIPRRPALRALAPVAALLAVLVAGIQIGRGDAAADHAATG